MKSPNLTLTLVTLGVLVSSASFALSNTCGLEFKKRSASSTIKVVAIGIGSENVNGRGQNVSAQMEDGLIRGAQKSRYMLARAGMLKDAKEYLRWNSKEEKFETEPTGVDTIVGLESAREYGLSAYLGAYIEFRLCCSIHATQRPIKERMRFFQQLTDNPLLREAYRDTVLEFEALEPIRNLLDPVVMREIGNPTALNEFAPILKALDVNMTGTKIWDNFYYFLGLRFIELARYGNGEFTRELIEAMNDRDTNHLVRLYTRAVSTEREFVLPKRIEELRAEATRLGINRVVILGMRGVSELPGVEVTSHEFLADYQIFPAPSVKKSRSAAPIEVVLEPATSNRALP